MRPPIAVFVLCAVFICLVAPARADERNVFDLAKHPPSALTLPVAPGSVSIIVTNRIPGRTYLYSVGREWVPIPPLALPQGLSVGIAGGAGNVACVALSAAYKAIASPDDESKVPATLKAVQALLDD